MITCDRTHLEARCRERGYTLDEVMPCVVSQDGDEWTIDVDHAAFPRVSRLPESPESPAPIRHGPGTELKKLLAGWPFYITASPDCSCNRVAGEMDVWGPDGCEQPEHQAFQPVNDAALRALGLELRANGESPIRGAKKGNVELLVHLAQASAGGLRGDGPAGAG